MTRASSFSCRSRRESRPRAALGAHEASTTPPAALGLQGHLHTFPRSSAARRVWTVQRHTGRASVPSMGHQNTLTETERQERVIHWLIHSSTPQETLPGRSKHRRTPASRQARGHVGAKQTPRYGGAKEETTAEKLGWGGQRTPKGGGQGPPWAGLITASHRDRQCHSRQGHL